MNKTDNILIVSGVFMVLGILTLYGAMGSADKDATIALAQISGVMFAMVGRGFWDYVNEK